MPLDENSPRDPEKLDDGDKKVLSDIERVGWHLVIIPEDEEGPGFAFTIGLFHSFDHPEVAVVGQKMELQEYLLNEIGTQVQSGLRFTPTERYPGLLEGPFDCGFAEIPKNAYNEYLGYAQWYYRDREFPALQCLWPDRQNRIPIDDDFEPRLRDRQPLMTAPG